MCTDMSTTLPLQRDGRIKAYAALVRTRTSLAPEIPTMGEVGLGELDIAFWRGLWVPKGTPKQTIAKLNSAVVEALADATVRRRIGELNQEISARELQTPEGFGALHRAEIEKWWPIIKAANIKTE